MNHKGFALLATLWVITALTVLGAAGVAAARGGSQATRNRVWLARAAWAREGCVEILLARYAQDPAVREVPVTDLGRGAWCRAELEDPGAKLNVNVADAAALRAVLPDTLVERVLAARRGGPLPDVRALLAIPGFDSSLVRRLEAVLTTQGTGVVSVNAAPPAVLSALPGVGEEAVSRVLALRSRPGGLTSADALVAGLSAPARAQLLREYPEFLRSAAFTPVQLAAVVDGGVAGTPIVARAVLTVVPAAGRLAVIRRDTE
jgi:type II secretory pathway component PulK